MTVSRPTMVLLATLTAGTCHRPPGGPDAANARRELAELVKVYEEASNQGDANELAALYGEEALLLPPDGGIVAGRDSIMGFWEDGLERGLTLDTLRVVAHERDGYVIGTYHMAPTDDAAADSGKYVMCFALGDEGWQLMADIWNATSADGPDDRDDADPRTRIIRAASTRPHYRFMTIDHRAMKRRTVDAHPTTLQRVKSRRMPRSSD
jgi:ketosteroid isomerase-like protein